jgi:hypothetical protein
MVKDAPTGVGPGSSEVFASKETAMTTIAVITAAVPYLKVHFPDIYFLSPASRERYNRIRSYVFERTFKGFEWYFQGFLIIAE